MTGLPSAFSYRALGKVRQKGVEFGVDGAFSKELSAYANYSYQPDPEAIGFDKSELNLPPHNRFNTGFNYSGPKYLGNAQISYQSTAYWQDVLDSRFHGPTEAFTLVNGSVGVNSTSSATSRSCRWSAS